MQDTLRKLRAGLALKAGLALAVVALGDRLFFQRGLGGGYFGALLLALLGALIAARPAVRRDRRAWAAAALAATYALAMGYDAGLLPWTLFWIAAGMATLLPATGAFDDGWRWFQRLFYHALTAGFGPIVDLAKFTKVRRSKPARRLSLRRSLPVLALPLLGSAVILALFAAANPILEQLLVSVRLPEPTWENLRRVALWCALFTLGWSLLRPRLPRSLIGTFDGSGDLALPGVSASSVTLSLVAFNLLFALQNAMDAAWLWGLMPLPQGMTLADYAHRGAYPLIATALLAALFVLVTLRPGSTTASMPVIRRLVVLWIGQNLFLVASSVLRTLDYVDAYSLTVLRISALAWMALVGLGLALICWRMLRGKSAGWLINTNLAAAGVLLSACCFVDLGAIAAQWNVRHAREVDGTGAALDLCYLDRLGGSALLPLIELEQRRLPGDLNARATIVRKRVQARMIDSIAKGGWTWLGARRLKEAGRLGARTYPKAARRPYDCDGRFIAPPPIEPMPPYPEMPAPAASQSRSTDHAPLTEKAER